MGPGISSWIGTRMTSQPYPRLIFSSTHIPSSDMDEQIRFFENNAQRYYRGIHGSLKGLRRTVDVWKVGTKERVSVAWWRDN